jgi:hypothetical protein
MEGKQGALRKAEDLDDEDSLCTDSVLRWIENKKSLDRIYAQVC